MDFNPLKILVNPICNLYVVYNILDRHDTAILTQYITYYDVETLIDWIAIHVENSYILIVLLMSSRFWSLNHSP